MHSPYCRMFRVASAVMAAALAASAAAERYPVGGSPMQLPAPPALIRVSDSVPAVLERLAAYAPAENRIVEIYVTPDDHATFLAGKSSVLVRFAQLAVLRSSEAGPFTARGFRSLVANLEKVLAPGTSELADATREQIAKGDAATKERYGTDVETSMDAVGYHGVYRRENRALFFSMSATLAAKAQADAERIFTAAAFVLIDGRVMLFSVYSEDTPPARAWARHTLDTWVETTRQANPDDSGVEVLSVIGVTPALQRVLLLGFAFTAVAVIAIAVLIRRRRVLAQRR